MRLIIHDLTEKAFALLGITNRDTTIIAADGDFSPCQGCFGCWLKTPGACCINDNLKHIGGLIGKSEELVLISRNRYGGYSEPVKRALDRGISASLPFFIFRDRALRHIPRYKIQKSCLTALLYGDFLAIEKETAEKIVENNRANLGFKEKKLIMRENIQDFKGSIP